MALGGSRAANGAATPGTAFSRGPRSPGTHPRLPSPPPQRHLARDRRRHGEMTQHLVGEGRRVIAARHEAGRPDPRLAENLKKREGKWPVCLSLKGVFDPGNWLPMACPHFPSLATSPLHHFPYPASFVRVRAQYPLHPRGRPARNRRAHCLSPQAQIFSPPYSFVPRLPSKRSRILCVKIMMRCSQGG